MMVPPPYGTGMVPPGDQNHATASTSSLQPAGVDVSPVGCTKANMFGATGMTPPCAGTGIDPYGVNHLIGQLLIDSSSSGQLVLLPGVERALGHAQDTAQQHDR